MICAWNWEQQVARGEMVVVVVKSSSSTGSQLIDVHNTHQLTGSSGLPSNSMHRVQHPPPAASELSMEVQFNLLHGFSTLWLRLTGWDWYVLQIQLIQGIHGLPDTHIMSTYHSYIYTYLGFLNRTELLLQWPGLHQWRLGLNECPRVSYIVDSLSGMIKFLLD